MGTFTRRTQSPSNDRIAGNSVIEASTAMNTAIAEANPSEVTNGIPATTREASAITTVLPAKTMALPEEAHCVCDRCLHLHALAELIEVLGHQEQRVVDAHRRARSSSRAWAPPKEPP